MISYKRGDVMLIGFVFSDESGKKRRPAVVISSPAYNQAGDDRSEDLEAFERELRRSLGL